MGTFLAGANVPDPLSIDTLTDGTDDGAWETLRESGYEIGDLFGPQTYHSGVNSGTTSNSYTMYSFDEFNPNFQWDVVFPTSVDIQVYASITVNPSTDQTDIRVRNHSESDTILEETGITNNTTVQMGPTTYQPTTTDGTREYRLEHRNNDNSTTVQITQMYIGFFPLI